MTQAEFDLMIGRLDRLLSELMIVAKQQLDEANRQTLKHHAEDIEAVCAVIRKRLDAAN